MATVITNLISAIPWIGKDVVESIKITVLINLCICMIIFFSSLPKIGNVHKNALKKFNKILDKRDYISIPSSSLFSRLNRWSWLYSKN